MSAGDGEALVRRAVEEIWNRGDLELGDALFGPTYVNHEGLIADLVRGPEAIKISVTLYRTAFPHFHVEIEDLVAAGDRVALRWTTRIDGAPEDSHLEDDGRCLTVTGMTLCRLSGGQIVETWTCSSALATLWRIGLTDEPAPDVADGSGPDPIKPWPPNARGCRRQSAVRFSRLCRSLAALREAGGE